MPVVLRIPHGRTSPGSSKQGILSGHFQYLALTLTLPGWQTKLVASQGLSVDYSSEIAEGLVLCPSDIDPSNFIIDSEGTIFAIDFGGTGYMPPSYVSYSFESELAKYFTRLVARRVNYPKSANLLAMKVAAGLLVISGNNSLGE